MGLNIATVIVLIVAFSNIIIVLLCIKGILAHQSKEINEGDITGEPFFLKDFFLQIIGYVLPISMIIGLLYIGDKKH